MRLDINLASHPYEDSRQFWLRWGAGLAFLGIVTLVLLYSVIGGWIAASRDRATINKAEKQIASLNNESASKQALLNRPENRTMRDRSEFLNDLFQRKAFSWTKVFEELERVMPVRLHVVSIKPETDSDTGQLRIALLVAGESRERAWELVHKMEASKRFQQTYIKAESPVENSRQGDNVQFEISAVYLPENEVARVQGGQ